MGDVLSVRIAGPDQADTIHRLLYEFNGEAVPPEELKCRLERAPGLETIFQE